MAIIHKCDRCGKVIPRDHGIARSFTHRAVIRGNIFFDLFVGKDLDEYERDIELCKECNESFADWFNAGGGVRKMKKGNDDVQPIPKPKERSKAV